MLFSNKVPAFVGQLDEGNGVLLRPISLQLLDTSDSYIENSNFTTLTIIKNF